MISVIFNLSPELLKYIVGKTPLIVIVRTVDVEYVWVTLPGAPINVSVVPSPQSITALYPEPFVGKVNVDVLDIVNINGSCGIDVVPCSV